MINKVNIKKGFTLIETLVAILILTMAIAGPLVIASKGLSAALIAKDRITAYYLAQDAIEYVRFIRDSNKLAGNPDWLAGLDNTTNTHTNLGELGGQCVSNNGGATCTVDALSDKILPCPLGGPCPPIKYDTSNQGFFSYDSGSILQPGLSMPSFTRTVSITSPLQSNANEAIVTVTVSWSDTAGLVRNVKVQENLFDWQ